MKKHELRAKVRGYVYHGSCRYARHTKAFLRDYDGRGYFDHDEDKFFYRRHCKNRRRRNALKLKKIQFIRKSINSRKAIKSRNIRLVLFDVAGLIYGSLLPQSVKSKLLSELENAEKRRH